VLQHLSQQLDIPLPMRGTVTHYNEAILSLTAVMSSVKKMKDVPIILTSNPDKLKFDIFDNIMNWIKASKFWQYMSSQFTQFRPEDKLMVMSPEQFEKKHQKQRFNGNETCREQRNKELLDTKNQYAKIWQELFLIEKSVKTIKHRKGNEKETNKEERPFNLKL
jgi:hypothetical protein